MTSDKKATRTTRLSHAAQSSNEHARQAEVSRNAPRLRRALLDWYGREARDLPWRHTRDPYAIWLSEIMLQQTRVETVVPYYERFIRAVPTVRDLARARPDKVLKLWEGLGYYARARNLHAAARQIVRDYSGQFPHTAREWQHLPGIGRYTAAAIASIAFDQRVPVLDGNVKRVLTRLFGVEASVDDSRTINELWLIADALVPRQVPGRLNQALMELGATVCAARRPSCERCPVRRWCEAFARGQVEKFPVRRPKPTTPHYEVVAAAIRKNGRYLLGQRPPNGMLGGLWEFPGGKVKPGETHEQALTRELKEELGIDVHVGPRLACVNHAYSHFSITLHVYACEHLRHPPRPRYHSQLKWVARSQFNRYAFPAANHKCFDQLRGFV